MWSRRRFLKGFSGGVAATGVAALAARTSLQAVEQIAGAAMSEAERWARIRREFMFDPHWAYMNNGTLGPTPKPVYYTVVERYRELAYEPGELNTLQGREIEDVRRKAARFVGANVDEIALTRNTTEGINFLINGLDLQAGDEILTTFHEHPGGMHPCRLKAKRHGVVLTEARWPAPASDPNVILNAFNDAITPRTRVIMASHVMYQTGSMIPLKALATLAREKNILTVIDGAHPLGMLALDMHDLGIDYYAMSPHKWLDAPSGTGLLYMRRASQDRVWPTVVSTGWDDPAYGAARYDRLSQRATPLVLAVGAALDFQDAIGRERVEARVHALQARLRSRLSALPGITFHTSSAPDLCGGLLAFTVGTLTHRDVVETVKQRHRIWVRTVDYDLNAVRASTHIFNTEDEVDRLGDAIEDCMTTGVMTAPPPLPPILGKWTA